VRDVLSNSTLATRRLALAVAAAVVALDQLVKWWAVVALPGKPVVLVDGVLQLRLFFNSGSAFSLVDGFGSVIALIAIAAAGFIFVVALKVERRGETIALGLVLGGAIGNLADRAFRADGFLDGGVVDFIDFSFFPAFNLADSAITIGAILALWFAFLDR